MKVIWTAQGFRKLIELVAYLTEFLGPEKANQFQQELIDYCTKKLKEHPERNPPCRFSELQKAGYRCLTFKKKYIVVFKEENKKVIIIGVFSSKRNPDVFNDLIK